MNSDQMKIQAKKAYEKARLIEASQVLWLLIPLIILSICACGTILLPISLGSLLAFAVVALKWKGQDYGHSVTPGLVAGTVAFLIPAVLHYFELCCEGHLETFVCIASGVIAGVILGLKISRSKRPDKKKLLLISFLVASLTASLGCIHLGVNPSAGLFGSLTLTSIAVFTFRKKFF